MSLRINWRFNWFVWDWHGIELVVVSPYPLTLIHPHISHLWWVHIKGQDALHAARGHERRLGMSQPFAIVQKKSRKGFWQENIIQKSARWYHNILSKCLPIICIIVLWLTNFLVVYFSLSILKTFQSFQYYYSIRLLSTGLLLHKPWVIILWVKYLIPLQLMCCWPVAHMGLASEVQLLNNNWIAL